MTGRRAAKAERTDGEGGGFQLRLEKSLGGTGWSRRHDAVEGQERERACVRVDDPTRALGDSVAAKEALTIMRGGLGDQPPSFLDRTEDFGVAENICGTSRSWSVPFAIVYRPDRILPGADFVAHVSPKRSVVLLSEVRVVPFRPWLSCLSTTCPR